MLRKVKRLPVMLVLITVFLGSLSGCGDSTDPLGTGIIQFYNATTGTVITTVDTQPNGTLTLVVRVMNLRSDGTLAPVIGERVTFTLLTPANGGGLIVVKDRTAGNGQAMAVYTAGNNAVPDSVRATTSTGATATITITKTGIIVGAYGITVEAVPETVPAAGGSSVITATVTDNAGDAVRGIAVTFTQTGGVSVLPASATTDGSGNAVVVFTAAAAADPLTASGTTAGVVTASITIDGTTYTDAVVITYE